MSNNNDIIDAINKIKIIDLQEKAFRLLNNSIRQIERIVKENRYVLDGESKIYDEGIYQVRRTKKCIYATSLIDARKWSADSILNEYFDVQKELKIDNSNVEIKRIFILQQEYLNSIAVREIIRAQIDAGFEIKIANIHTLSIDAPELLNDFVIFDNKRAIWVKMILTHFLRGELTYNKEDIITLQSNFKDLWERSNHYG